MQSKEVRQKFESVEFSEDVAAQVNELWDLQKQLQVEISSWIELCNAEIKRPGPGYINVIYNAQNNIAVLLEQLSVVGGLMLTLISKEEKSAN